MKSKSVWMLTMLMLALLLAPMALKAQTQEPDDVDLEILDPALDDDTGTTASAEVVPAQTPPWPVCRFGHWIRSGPGYPPVCTRQHIDALNGPLAPCSIITIGGVKYHIRKVVRTSRGWIITIKRI